MIINNNSNYLDSNKHKGHPYLKKDINDIIKKDDNLKIDSNIINIIIGDNINLNEHTTNIEKNNKFNLIYKKLIQRLNSLKSNNFYIKDIETVRSYISLKKINGLDVFIIEISRLQYFLDAVKQSKGTTKDISLCLSDIDIVSLDKISEQTKYSFINEEILKYFNLENLNDLPKVFLFSNEKNIYIYYQKQNCIVNVINYNNNKFN